MSDAYLVFPNGAEYPLVGELRVGRDPRNELVLDTKSISREHARITAVNGRWFVEDRGSYNGTRVNGERDPPGVAAAAARRRPRHDRPADESSSARRRTRATPTRPSPWPSRSRPLARALSPLQRRVVGLLCAELARRRRARGAADERADRGRARDARRDGHGQGRAATVRTPRPASPICRRTRSAGSSAASPASAAGRKRRRGATSVSPTDALSFSTRTRGTGYGHPEDHQPAYPAFGRRR